MAQGRQFIMFDSDERAFEVLEIEQLDESLCRIGGLTFKTLRIGDHMCIYGETANTVSDSDALIVTRMHLFNRDWDEVERGFYIELFLQRAKERTLQGAKYLRLSQSR